MKILRFVVVVLLTLAAASAHAQATTEEISFWESVRNSNNAVELQAYLERWPNGTFAPLARARLAALGAPVPAAPKPAAELASTAPAMVTGVTSGPPQVGDTWTYRLSYPRIRGAWGQPARPARLLVIKVGSVADNQIVDQLSIDGGAPRDVSQTKGAYLHTEGVSVFSPYLRVFQDLSGKAAVNPVEILDAACLRSAYACTAKARIVGQETVKVPAGSFQVIRIVVEHSWQPGNVSGPRLTGGRQLTVYYSPAVKRAVKYASRKTVGDQPPVEADFDLELVSFQQQ